MSEAKVHRRAANLCTEDVMQQFRLPRKLGVFAFLTALTVSANAQQVKKVFIAMENHNWTQPANQFSGRHSAGLSESERAVYQ
jgi:hypothetical protein